VLVAVVEDAVRAVGALGTAVQVFANVVTPRDPLAFPVPAESEAETVNTNVTPGDKPPTAKLVFVVVPMDVPF